MTKAYVALRDKLQVRAEEILALPEDEQEPLFNAGVDLVMRDDHFDNRHTAEVALKAEIHRVRYGLPRFDA